MEWDTGSYWIYTLGDRFVVSYSVVGSREQLVNRKPTPCHVVVISAGRTDNIPYLCPIVQYPHPVSFFDVEVMDVTKEELGVVMGKKIVMNLTLPPETNSDESVFVSYPDGDQSESFTKRVNKETVKIKDRLFENCDKIIHQDPEGRFTYWYSDEIQNHVKIASDEGFLMELYKSGRNVNLLDSIYEMLLSMSKSRERSHTLRCIRALVELREIIDFCTLTDILLKLSDSDDWYVAEKATDALKRLIK